MRTTPAEGRKAPESFKTAEMDRQEDAPYDARLPLSASRSHAVPKAFPAQPAGMSPPFRFALGTGQVRDPIRLAHDGFRRPQVLVAHQGLRFLCGFDKDTVGAGLFPGTEDHGDGSGRRRLDGSSRYPLHDPVSGAQIRIEETIGSSRHAKQGQ